MARNCTPPPELRFWGSCECTCPEPDPDIAGIGVISSFMTSSALAIVSTCLYLLIIRSGLEPEDSFNPIDGWARRTFCNPFVDFITKAQCIKTRMDKIEATIFSFVLSLADMQLVTGIAMLSAAVIKLHDEKNKISIYHFSMVTNLAWFSSTVHLLTMLAIRTKVIGSMKKQPRREWPGQEASSRHRRARAAIGWGGDVIVRIISMLLLAALLLYCSYVSGASEWYIYDHCPARCSLGKEKGGEPLQWAVVNFVLILLEYPRQCLALWRTLGRWWIDKARHHFLDNKGLGEANRSSNTPALMEKDFCLKRFHELWKGRVDIDNENNAKGFGQLVPILLLGMPFLQALQTYSGKFLIDRSRMIRTLS
ncbi:uncharacterized protein NECHADRAFT_45252 [Fusarium vanettenii 77-13-4]|uniref:Uncharacterized protein n=1 Tax=Fusarium vanettenii (strain ATCC MYA-4622 / CBS 123669 / FGSC 9596 / NRRL 45880 / 77-13-4) TaxID=660122 RepID=C7YX61_FUSV7|nr:uncharacterized protein NECHADRAFT_45252 [Fusarium vanettenii 77-13-4]EEU43529.1 hypothetical protein NECHADRAFT_45252 [Fusarium vanettenii 77-13-4]